MTWAIVTPKVLAQAQAEFDYAGLEALELDIGSSYSMAGSNWEKRIMANDILTRGNDIEGTIISQITLEAMADSGWYDATPGSGTKISWGYNDGEDFINNKCIDNGKAVFDEFCDNMGRYSACDNSHTHIGTCNLKNFGGYEMPPPAYRYFHNPMLGGSDVYADYCPYVEPYTFGDCRNPDNDRRTDKMYGEKAGENSRCIEGSFAPYGYYPKYHGACHEITCRADGFDIAIGSAIVSCSKNVHGVANDVITGISGF
jgi:hypothetical protein